MRILFPAAGGEPTMAALSALRAEWHGPGELYCIGTDIADWKRSLLALDDFVLAPMRSAQNYIPFLLDLCDQHKVSVLWPNPTEEQLILAPHRTAFEKNGVQVLMPPASAVQLFSDKAETYRYATRLGIRSPQYRLVASLNEIEKTAKDFGYPSRPVVFRRVQGRGGLGIKVLQEGSMLAHDLFEVLGGGRRMTLPALLEVLGWVPTWPDSMVCEYLPGLEYDVDCLCDGEQLVQAVVRRNDQMGGGTSMLAEVVDRPDLIEIAKKILESLHWRYICSVSFKEDCNGHPVLMEINPRMPSSINLTWQAGCNMPLEALKMCTGKRSVSMTNSIRVGTKIARYLGEIYIL